MDIVSFSNQDLEDAPMLGDTCTCWKCGKQHKVEHGISKDGPNDGAESPLLQFFKCPLTGHAYLCGVKGKKVQPPT